MIRNTVWDEEKILLLTKLWSLGLPATAIGQELGVTRNSVIGKAHRLNLYRCPLQPTPREPKPKREKTIRMVSVKPKPRPPMPSKPIVTDIVVPSGQRSVPLQHARKHHCRAIVGYTDNKLDQAIYCGEPVTVGKLNGQPLSWCSYHHSIYLELPKERRR